jgi:hypothetical protein
MKNIKTPEKPPYKENRYRKNKPTYHPTSPSFKPSAIASQTKTKNPFQIKIVTPDFHLPLY